MPCFTTNETTASRPSPLRMLVKTKGRSPRCLRASRSMTSSDAPTCGARSVLLMTSKSLLVMPGRMTRGWDDGAESSQKLNRAHHVRLVAARARAGRATAHHSVVWAIVPTMPAGQLGDRSGCGTSDCGATPNWVSAWHAPTRAVRSSARRLATAARAKYANSSG
jgi:hypothetical protein